MKAKKETLTIRIHTDLKQKARQEAERKGLTLSSYLNLVLSERLESEGKL